MARMSTAHHDPRTAVDGLFAALDPLACPTRMRTLAAWTRDRLPDVRDAALAVVTAVE